ncbi:MAG: PIG-L family deacetylase [Bacteroidetes bacterium]|nr:PIG-L family deacetylase [Bacteroidota bacterium]
MRLNKLLFFLLIGLQQSFAQPTVSSIYHGIKKLGVTGTVLYIAAHPDDENTRLITYLANDRLLRTGYLSLTRGDGGQNLIGQEQGIELGLIRTQELLAARRIDGGEQFFTRAYDFGYSKTPTETFKIWDREKILHDVVWVIRTFKPDVVITRFPTTGEGGHGHHTASAILAGEAVKAAADPTRFPEQLALTGGAWRVKRLFWNTFNFGGNSTIREDQLKIDVGGYNSLLGKSYGEIAAQSRSQHKSQGFGVPVSRGEAFEYFKLIDGASASKDIMEGISLDWGARLGSSIIQQQIDSLLLHFNWLDPKASLPGLLNLYQSLEKLEPTSIVTHKKKELKELILAVSGIYLEATSSQLRAVQGDSVQVALLAIDRLGTSVTLERAQVGEFNVVNTATALKLNKPFTVNTKFLVRPSFPISQPYWLQLPMQQGYFVVNDLYLIGKPENEAPLSCTIDLKWGTQVISYQVPVRYKFTDPVKGELQWPLEVVPPVSIQPDELVHLITAANNPIKGHAQVAGMSAQANLKPELISNKKTKSRVDPLLISSLQKDQLESFDYFLTPKENADTVTLGVSLSNGNRVNTTTTVIRYDHIPPITYFKTASVYTRNFQVKIAGKNIGYIPGAGDKIPDGLKRLGYNITVLDENLLSTISLQQFDAIITGVRAHNTQEWLNKYYEKLMAYVEQGGNYLVQYNTSNQIGPVKAKIGPYPFAITRNRITDQDAAVVFLDPTHPVFNFPNRILPQDFEGWVQERSIYHGLDTAGKLQPLLSMADPDEKPDTGSLLVARYGKGWFTYTGLSLFRQIPAGVTGAYRLLANLLALGNVER